MKKIEVTTFYAALRSVLCRMYRTVFPWTVVEKSLFGFFFVLYGAIGLLLALSTDWLDRTDGGNGSYLGYDHLSLLVPKGGNFDIAHPFFSVIHFLKYLISLPFVGLFGAKSLTVCCVLMTNVLVTSGLVLIYRYLRRITELPVLTAVLLTVMTGFYFTTIVLSFTFETYPFSLFVSVLSLYVLSSDYREKRYFPLKDIFFFEFLCGGITISNAAKPLWAIWLNRDSFAVRFRQTIRLGMPFALCVVAVLAVYSIKGWLFTPELLNPADDTLYWTRYMIFDGHFPKQVLTDFFGSTLLVAPLEYIRVGKEVVLRPASYEHVWQMVFVACWLCILAVGLLRCRREQLVRLLGAYLLVDGVIHLICRYGMDEAIIFGGHWLFLVPLVAGWLCKSLPMRWHGHIQLFLLVTIGLLVYNNAGELLHAFDALRFPPAALFAD